MSELKLRYKIPEVAAVIGIRHTTIYQRIKQGKLRAHKDGHGTFITRAELLRYVQTLAGETVVEFPGLRRCTGCQTVLLPTIDGRETTKCPYCELTTPVGFPAASTEEGGPR
ncbi:MAG: helix-turn-helix domain-containing protein [Steroidobacteraceae bacterium]